MENTTGSEYLKWVKMRTPARFNLAASGVSPCPLSELAADTEDLEINGPGLYGFEPLQQAIAAHCRVSADCVVAASGTSMANFIAMAAVIQSGDEVLIEHPVYDPLLAVARHIGAEIKRFPRERRIQDFVSKRTRLIIMTNLHNPTCSRLSEEELYEIRDVAQATGARVLMDEVYLECLYEKSGSAFHLGEEFICTGSLTKAYGLGGLRCGWILAKSDLARRMWWMKDLIETSAPHTAEQLSVVAFKRLDHLAARAKAILDRNRALFVDFQRSCPDVELAMPVYGTCVFPRIKSGDADRLFELLHTRYDTDVVPGRFFEKPDHVRIGLGVDNHIFAEGLERLRIALAS